MKKNLGFGEYVVVSSRIGLFLTFLLTTQTLHSTNTKVLKGLVHKELTTMEKYTRYSCACTDCDTYDKGPQ